jgi:thiamine pyrophosphokinase
MSSHHFVKEFQEPALFIQSAQKSDFDKIAGLLEWAPFIVVHENALGEVLDWGIKIDAVLCKEENREWILEILYYQWNVEIIPFPPKKSEVQTILELVLEKGGTDLNIFNHDFHPNQLPKNKAHSGTYSFFDTQLKWFYLLDLRVEKWLPAHSKFYIFQIDVPFEVKGQIQNLGDGEFITQSEGLIEICSNEGLLWIGMNY